MADRTVLVKLKADTSQYKSQIGDAAKQTDKLDDAQRKAQEGASKWRAVGMLATAKGAAIALGLVKATKSASDLNESMNAVQVTFGKASGAIQRMGEDAARSMGLSNTEFNNLAVRFSNFANTLAGDGGNVTEVIRTLTQRAADFASVMNMEVAQAAQLFQSGLAGESEPLRQYGIDLAASTVKAVAYAEGIAAVGSELTEQQRIQARYVAIMDQTQKMHGDFANTSDSAANAMRTARAEFENASAALGNALLPALSTVMSTASEMLGVFNSLPDGVKEGLTWIAMFGSAALVVGPQVQSIATAIQSVKAATVEMKAATSLGSIFSGLATSTGLVTTALVGAGVAFAAFAVHSANVEQAARRIVDTLDEITGAATEATRAMIAETFLEEFESVDLGRTPFQLQEIVAAVTEGGEAFDALRGRMVEYAAVQAQIGGDARLASALLSTTDNMREQMVAAQLLSGELRQVESAARPAGTALDEVGNAAIRAAAAKHADADAARRLTSEMHSLLSASLALAGSELALAGMRSRLAEAVDEYGTSLSRATENGRANQEQLQSEMGLILQYAENARRAQEDAGNGARKQQAAWSGALRQGIRDLVAHSDAVGLNRKTVIGLIADMSGLPRRKVMELLLKGGKDAKADLDAVNRKAKDGPKSKKVDTSAPGSKQASKDLAGVNRAAKDGPKSKKIKVYADGSAKAAAELDKVNRLSKAGAKTKQVKVSAPGAAQARSDLQSVKKAAEAVPDTTTAAVKAAGTSAAAAAINVVRAAAVLAEGTYFVNIVTRKTTEGAAGGLVGYSSGGRVRGPGTETSDDVPAMLSRGEYVIRASSVRKYGTGMLDRINWGVAARMARGGSVFKPDQSWLGSRGPRVRPDSAASAQAAGWWAGFTAQWIADTRLAFNEGEAGASAYADAVADAWTAEDRRVEDENRTRQRQIEDRNIKWSDRRQKHSEKLAKQESDSQSALDRLRDKRRDKQGRLSDKDKRVIRDSDEFKQWKKDRDRREAYDEATRDKGLRRQRRQDDKDTERQRRQGDRRLRAERAQALAEAEYAGARQVLIERAAEAAEENRRKAAEAEADARAEFERLEQARTAYSEQVADSLKSNLSALSAFDFNAHEQAVDAVAAAEERAAQARRDLLTASPSERRDRMREWREAEEELAKARKAQKDAEPTGANVLAGFKERSRIAKEFESRIEGLRSRGLSDSIIRELSTADPRQAMELLKAFGGMSASQLAEVNRQQQELEAVASRLGGNLASAFYDTDVANAQKAWDAAKVQVEIAAAPVAVQIDGKTIAEALIEYRRRSGVVEV